MCVVVGGGWGEGGSCAARMVAAGEAGASKQGGKIASLKAKEEIRLHAIIM